ncbi:ABC transporter ATP-binding protein [Staphylococcus kloosii]|uniref:ABC transporter ATP-binding protein n=1 Tax=Staphylococcus kloosii TaxID=29384 RepID=UPI0028A42332|nr:ABC transporter ATP-binding protein [Staphylococcus kloosii]MDT3959814.1 ABC transporter ATP-binding protein [Staphylococcus kloosii]
MERILDVRNLKKIYGSKGTTFTALNEIDLYIYKGEFVGVMGPSGSGKSTLLNILATIDSLSLGDVLIDGVNIKNMNEEELSTFRLNKLGFIFQDYNLLDTLTVKENILLPLAIAKTNVKEIESRVEKVSKTFGIGNILDKYPHQISGGQKQRTAASRAIITNPSIVLADEPTGALDSKSAANLLESLTQLSQYEKSTILMVTHDALAASYCDRITFIKDGQTFTELVKGNLSRQDFFNKILEVLSAIGGGTNDII